MEEELLTNESPEATDASVPADSDAPAAVSGPSIVLLRDGQESDAVFGVHENSVIGRFDPGIGPIDIDLGGLDIGSYVSRKHASISKGDDGEWKITDLGSSNGTWIKNEFGFEKTESAILSDGSVFALGNAQFVFHTGEAAACEDQPAEPEAQA